MTAKQPTAFDMSMIAFYTFVEAEHAHGKATEKISYIRKPLGSSMYKVLRTDQTGIYFEKYRDYKHGGTAKPASTIGKMNLLFISEPGTRVAHFIDMRTLYDWKLAETRANIPYAVAAE